MSEPTPACPNCRVRTFMVRDRSAERAGTMLGALFGAGSALSATKAATITAIALCSLSPTLLTRPLANPITLGTLTIAALTGSTTGGFIGQQLDAKLRMQYRCNRCGCVVQG